MLNNYRIRDAVFADCSVLANLSAQLGYPVSKETLAVNFKHLSEKTGAEIFVAEKDGVVVGYISMDRYDTLYMESGLNITGLIVDSHCRGQRIGHALLAAAEQYAWNNGLAFVRINSGADRKKAHEFYRKNGYMNEKDQKRFIKMSECAG